MIFTEGDDHPTGDKGWPDRQLLFRPSDCIHACMQARNLEIDRLRAAAILMVLFSHSGELTQHQVPVLDTIASHLATNLGVVLFFAISGYVISAALIPAIDADDGNSRPLASFWLKRLTRITPMALLWIAIPLALCGFFNLSGTFGSLEKNVPAGAAAAFNFYNLYTITPHGDLFGIYWSLSFEEQFYLAFPIFLLLIRGPYNRIAGLVAVYLAINTLPLWLSGVLRVDAVGAGAILYILHSRGVLPRLNANVWVGQALSLVLLVALITVTLPLSTIFPTLLVRPIPAAISAILLYLAIQRRGFVFPILFSSTITDWVATRSYGIYLIHYPSFLLATELAWREPSLNHVACRVVIAFIVTSVSAELCYRYFESPIRNWGRDMAKSLPSRARKQLA
jgi:peptidoglycan/LPS O-acetylase OafA/YrhL